jgi:RNA polymerase sigma-70 factor (ECF subfamily)
LAPAVLHLAAPAAGPIASRPRVRRDTHGEEAEVVAALAGGDHTRAITLLMRHFGTAIYGFVRRMVRDDALADDIHQQIFIQAHRDFGAFAGRGLAAWLYGIARNRCIDALRAQRRSSARRADDAIEEAEAGAVPVDVLIDDGRRLAALAACLDTLAPHARTAVILRFHEGFSFEEMGTMCGERAGTLQQRVTRALPVLRRCMEKRLAEAP